jgi:hypothetical protein
MKRLLFAFAMILATLVASSTAMAQSCPPQSRYGEWVRVSRNGEVTYRYTYRGKTNGFPPPAMYYYGYPQSGYSYGIGF